MTSDKPTKQNKLENGSNADDKDRVITTDLSLKYIGPELESGEMNLGLLAPALVSFNELISEVHSVLNPGGARLYIYVNGYEGGSFKTAFKIQQKILARTRDFLAGKNVTSIANLAAIIGLVQAPSASLIEVFCNLKGRTPDVVRALPDGRYEVVTPGSTIIISKEVRDLLLRPKVAKALAGAVHPLTTEGIDSLDVSVEGAQTKRITKDQAHILSLPYFDQELVGERYERVVVGAKKIVLPLPAQWTFTRAGMIFKARITDPTFIPQANRNAYSLEDHFDVDLLTKKLKGADGNVEYSFEITKVHRRIARAEQEEMGF